MSYAHKKSADYVFEFAIIFQNVITNLFLYFLVRCLKDSKFENQSFIGYFFPTVSLLQLVYYFKCIRNKINIQNCLNKFQIFIYLKELPLAYISFYYLTQVFYLNSMPELNSYILILNIVYFSFSGVFICILIEFKQYLSNDEVVGDDSALSLFKKLLFSFLFRYFFFISKLISLILFLSTYNDEFQVEPNSAQIKKTKQFYKNALALIFTLVFSFLIYFIWFGAIQLNNAKKSIKDLVNAFCQSFKMLVDFNYVYFETMAKSSLKFKLLKLELSLKSLVLVIFMQYQFLIHVICAYFWYFRAIIIFENNHSKTTLLNLFTRIQNKDHLLGLFELEAKIKFRQFLLVILAGSLLISILCYHIYYTYYYNKTNYTIESANTSKYCSTRASLMENRLKSTDIQTISSYVDHFDGFSIKSFQQSSTIFSLQSNSFDNCSTVDSFNLKTLQCSTCSTLNPYLSKENVYSSEMDSTLSLSSDNYENYNVKRKKSTSSNRYMIDFETSSGIISSEMSSMSSIYDLSYLRNYEPTVLWNGNNNSSIENSQDSEWCNENKLELKNSQFLNCSNLNNNPIFSAKESLNIKLDKEILEKLTSLNNLTLVI